MAAVQGCHHSAAEFLLACEGVDVNAANQVRARYRQSSWQPFTFASLTALVAVLVSKGGPPSHSRHDVAGYSS